MITVSTNNGMVSLLTEDFGTVFAERERERERERLKPI
jgi:hypothetical protein